MSATSYNTSTCAPAQRFADLPIDLGVKLGYIEGNHFKFDYEHSKIIYDRCLDHVITCQLSSRCFRIFHAILRQTIGFQKREDAMTTTRLEQLTNIRHDHAGKVMRYLAKQNIIKCRKGGKYNNYLSINFNFAAWGHKNIEQRPFNNDPTGLLPTYFLETPIDQGLCFDENNDDSQDIHTDNPIENDFNPPEKPKKTPLANAINPDNSEDTQQLINSDFKGMIVNTIKELFEQQLPKLTSQLSTHIQPSQSKTNQDTDQDQDIEQQQQSSPEDKNQTIDIEEYNQLKKQIKQQNNELENELKQAKQQLNAYEQDQSDKKILEQLLFERQQYGEKKQQELTSLKQHTEQVEAENQSLKQTKADKVDKAEKPVQNNTPSSPNPTPKYSPYSAEYNNAQVTQVTQIAQSINSTLSNSATSASSNQTSVVLNNLNYPVQLSAIERQSLQNLLSKNNLISSTGTDPDAQKILNLLSLRLINVQHPLNNKVAYFAQLLKNYRENTLDFSALESFKTPQEIQTEKAIKHALDEQIDALHELDARVRHYKRLTEDFDPSADHSNDQIQSYTRDINHLNDYEARVKKMYYQISDYVTQHQLDQSMLKRI